MENRLSRNIKLGIFIFSGTLFFLVFLYFVGSKRSFFYSTIRLKAQFYNAEGLMRGNSVRFSGINIGTVESVSIINDSIVLVEMIIQKTVIKHIKKNSVASIGTDGLMGNKIVNIASINKLEVPVEDEDELISFKGINTEDMIKTLSESNENIKNITSDLKNITGRLNDEKSVIKLLTDDKINSDIKSSVDAIRISTSEAKELIRLINKTGKEVNEGKGVLGLLINNDSIKNEIESTFTELKKSATTLKDITNNINSIAIKTDSGNGTIGLLLNDTSTSNNIKKSVDELQKSSVLLTENLEAIQHMIFFRKYFRKKKK
jgi:phospholipid/cholesterol/gamma-HCH transport system substrate-binding protein